MNREHADRNFPGRYPNVVASSLELQPKLSTNAGKIRRGTFSGKAAAGVMCGVRLLFDLPTKPSLLWGVHRTRSQSSTSSEHLVGDSNVGRKEKKTV